MRIELGNNSPCGADISIQWAQTNSDEWCSHVGTEVALPDDEFKQYIYQRNYVDFILTVPHGKFRFTKFLKRIHQAMI